MLRAFAQQVLNEVRQSQGNSQPAASLFGQSPLGTLTDVQLHLDTPIQGDINGNPVTIIAEGNKVGFSPVSWCVDTEQENAWVPTELIRITDPRYQPVQVANRQQTQPREYSNR